MEIELYRTALCPAVTPIARAGFRPQNVVYQSHTSVSPLLITGPGMGIDYGHRLMAVHHV